MKLALLLAVVACLSGCATTRTQPQVDLAPLGRDLAAMRDTADALDALADELERKGQ